MIGNFPMVSAKLAHESKSQTKGEIVVAIGTQTNIQIIEPQPLKMNELAMLEPGERLYNWRTTWTATLIIPTDEIEYNSKKYRVAQVNDRNIEGSFYRVMMREKVTNCG
jgi:hypothetical protein